MAIGRVMALDVGKVRVGVALSDPLGYTAQPLLTLWRKSRGEDLRSLLRLIRRHLWDERLSSVAAHEILDEAGHDRQDRKHLIDQVAAVVILRGWMEAKEEVAARTALERSQPD
jgi:putative holliday junction resolvase